MTNKEKYRKLCETEGARIPLFLQYWWWDAVSDGKPWDVLLCEEDGHVKGAMPYLVGRKLMLRYSLMPQLTMFTGPWLANPDDTDTLAALYERFRRLGFAFYVGRFSPELTEKVKGESLKVKGGRVEMRNTYRFAEIAPLPELMAGASQLRRRDIARLASMLTIDTRVTPASFAAFHSTCYRERGKHDLLKERFMTQVIEASVDRSHGMIVGARGENGNLLAAVFVVYDSSCAYLMLLAHSVDAPRNAMSFLIWQTVDMMRQYSKAFDFEGGNEPGIEQFYRSFGAEATPVLQLSFSRIPFSKI